MYLTEEQLKTYEDNGFVLLNACFSQPEIELMKAELPTLFAEETSKRVLEEEGNTVRSVHGSHTTNEVFRRLSRHPRLVLPAMHILGSKVYVYQFKINAKAAFSGDVWEWHQDYIFWKKEDGLRTPRVTNALVFLDEMNELNGPLFFMVGSHKEGMIEVKNQNFKENREESKVNEFSWKSSFTAKLKYSLNQKMIADLASKYKIVSIKALPGSVLFFDSNIVHSSPNNISPFDRSVVIVTFNSTENIPSTVENPRPDFLVSRDFRPIEPLSDDALLIQSVS